MTHRATIRFRENRYPSTLITYGARWRQVSTCLKANHSFLFKQIAVDKHAHTYSRIFMSHRARAQEAIRRLSALTPWSQPRLIEAFILKFQDRWLARFSGDECRRYDAGSMNYAEAIEIRRLALKRREPPPQAVNARTARPASCDRIAEQRHQPVA